MDPPHARDGDAEDSLNRGRLDDEAEGLVVADAMLLREAANHLARLVAVPSKWNLCLKIYLDARWSKYEVPCVVIDEGLELFGHGCTPVQVGQPALVVPGISDFDVADKFMN